MRPGRAACWQMKATALQIAYCTRSLRPSAARSCFAGTLASGGEVDGARSVIAAATSRLRGRVPWSSPSSSGMTRLASGPGDAGVLSPLSRESLHYGDRVLRGSSRRFGIIGTVARNVRRGGLRRRRSYGLVVPRLALNTTRPIVPVVPAPTNALPENPPPNEITYKGYRIEPASYRVNG